MVFERRKINEGEAFLVSEETKNNLHLGFYSVSEWMKYNCVVLTDGNELIGVCAIIANHTWTKLGPLIVFNKFQGKGYGKSLIKYAIAHLPGNIYLRTTNPIIAKIATNSGFRKESNLLLLPAEIKIEQITTILSHLYMIRKYLKDFHSRGITVYYLKEA